VQVDIWLEESLVMRAPARTALASQKPAQDRSVDRRNADGSRSLVSLEFAGEEFTLIFD